MNRSIFYHSPLLYQLMLIAVHGRHLKERYETIAERVNDNDSVLEPLCGPALLPKYLPSGASYAGFDLNPHFIRSAKKRGVQVWAGDARNAANYTSADVVAIIDGLHHLQPYAEQQRVVEHAASVAKKKVILCEPFGDFYLDLTNRFPVLCRPAAAIFNWIEMDGPNQSRFECIIRREELQRRMEDGYGVLRGARQSIQKLGEDLIATYYL